MKSLIHSASIFGDGASEAVVETKLSLGMGMDIKGLNGSEIVNGFRRVFLTLTAVSGLSLKPWNRISVRVEPDNPAINGQSFQLPISLGILTAARRLRSDDLGDFLVVGSVDSYGRLHGKYDVRPLVCVAIDKGLKAVIVPRETEHEPKQADPYQKITVYYANTLNDACDIISVPSSRIKYQNK